MLTVADGRVNLILYILSSFLNTFIINYAYSWDSLCERSKTLVLPPVSLYKYGVATTRGGRISSSQLSTTTVSSYYSTTTIVLLFNLCLNAIKTCYGLNIFNTTLTWTKKTTTTYYWVCLYRATRERCYTYFLIASLPT